MDAKESARMHSKWVEGVIQCAIKNERERIIAHLGTAFLNYVAHDPEKRLFLVGTENIRHAIESMPSCPITIHLSNP